MQFYVELLNELVIYVGDRVQTVRGPLILMLIIIIVMFLWELIG